MSQVPSMMLPHPHLSTRSSFIVPFSCRLFRLVMLRYIMLSTLSTEAIRLLGPARNHHPASILHSVSFHGVARVHGRKRGYLDPVFPVGHTFKGLEITFTQTLHKTGCPSPHGFRLTPLFRVWLPL